MSTYVYICVYVCARACRMQIMQCNCQNRDLRVGMTALVGIAAVQRLVVLHTPSQAKICTRAVWAFFAFVYLVVSSTK